MDLILSLSVCHTSAVQLGRALQYGVGNSRKNLAQCQQQRLRPRHAELCRISGKQLTFEDAGFVWPNSFAQSISHGSLQPRIVLDWNEVRMIFSEPRQQAGMNLAVKIIHQKRAKDRYIMLLGELIEEVLKIHAGRYITTLPEDVDHLSPPANLREAVASPGAGDDIRCQTQEYRGIRHPVVHEAGQSFIRIDDRQLAAFLGCLDVYAFGDKARAEGIPVLDRRNEDNSLAVRQRGGSEATNRPIQKVLILVELHHVIARCSLRQKAIPIAVLSGITLFMA